MRLATIFVAVFALCSLPAASQAQTDFVVLNEVYASHTGTDNQEFIELCGTPGLSLDDLTVVVIEGEATSSTGVIDRVWSLAGHAIPLDGYFVLADDGVVNQDFSIGTSNALENGTETVLLVRNYAGHAIGTDVDADDDGVAELGIGTVVDGIGIREADAADKTYYGVPELGPDPDGFFPAGVARCDDCNDAFNTFLCFGFSGCADPFQDISPGTANDCPPVPTQGTSWGRVKGIYR